ncbi:tyrosine-type recombinase/integrase [Pseudomonas turukhanskensis]|uniref:tyrosine-type recombinase/integrase n=1 Tax=Pseudomonas turukhanskensis TaxID=1806536 RepID=UPI0022F2AC6A|nr:tyrosine-type recombinase/integrase [Pseudomonas turukhanskensis]
MASATIDQALRSIAILLTVLRTREIDLSIRLNNSRFLDAEEIDAIVKAAGIPNVSLRDYLTPTKQKHIKPFLVHSLESFRMSKQSEKNPASVSPSTTSIRLFYIKQFIDWRLTSEILKSDTTKKSELSALKTLIDLDLKNRSPTQTTRNNLSARTGINRKAQSILISCINLEINTTLWHSTFAKQRNELIIHFFLGTGIRRSELLGLRIQDIRPRMQEMLILRRPDDRDDPRLVEPNAKTQDRAIPLTSELYKLTKNYLITRNKIVKGKHDFLITSTSGSPLSKSEINRIFREFDSTPELKGLSPHILRHTYCENLAEDLHASGYSQTEILTFLRRLGGWSDSSNTPRRYISRFINETAANAGLELQKKIFI